MNNIAKTKTKTKQKRERKKRRYICMKTSTIHTTPHIPRVACQGHAKKGRM